MNADSLFQLASIIAAVGWIILLIASPFWPGYDKFVVGIIVTLLALIYSFLNFSNFHVSDLKAFGSLEGIFGLYKNPYILLAGWVHFLAFDLFVAVWIKKNSVKYGIGHLWVVIPIFFTCMLGPLGFLLYILIRSVKSRGYFLEN
jgi:hypothetical protein